MYVLSLVDMSDRGTCLYHVLTAHLYIFISCSYRPSLYLYIMFLSPIFISLYYVLPSSSHPKVPEDEADPGP